MMENKNLAVYVKPQSTAVPFQIAQSICYCSVTAEDYSEDPTPLDWDD